MLLALIGLFLLSQWLVQRWQKPGHMGVLESQSMEMSVTPPTGAMPVEIETVRLQPFSSGVTYTGTAVAYNDVTIYPRTEGWVASMPVYPGDTVKQGQLLAQLDSRELKSRLDEARFAQQAGLQNYNAALSTQAQAQAQQSRSQQAIQLAKANLTYWQAEIRRSQALVKEEVITIEEAQREHSQFEAAQSQYRQALSEARAVQQGAVASRFQSLAQQAAAKQSAIVVQTRSIIQGYTRITAPTAGVITERMVSPGTLVSTTMPLMRVAQVHPIRLQVNVAESDLTSLKVGNPVQAWAQQNPDKPINTRITAIFPKSEAQTRTHIVEAVFANTTDQFVPGDYVVMRLNAENPTNTLTVPTNALIERKQQTAIWVALAGKAHLSYVTTAGSNGNRTAINQGLKPAEKIIIRGFENLEEGSAIVEGHYGPNGLKALPKVVADNTLSAQNHYQLTRPVGDYRLALTLISPPPKVGSSTLEIKLESAMSGMAMSSDGLTVELQTLMPAMSSMQTEQPTIQKTGKDIFKGIVHLSMAGLWQITVTVKDKNQTLARFPITVEAGE